ncbi:hypothetical protein ACFE04_008347 [Oxalis oulophora]
MKEKLSCPQHTTDKHAVHILKSCSTSSKNVRVTNDRRSKGGRAGAEYYHGDTQECDFKISTGIRIKYKIFEEGDRGSKGRDGPRIGRNLQWGPVEAGKSCIQSQGPVGLRVRDKMAPESEGTSRSSGLTPSQRPVGPRVRDQMVPEFRGTKKSSSQGSMGPRGRKKLNTESWTSWSQVQRQNDPSAFST